MDMQKQSEHVARLIEKAAEAKSPEDAMRYSQAACNAANAMCATQAALGKK